MLIVQNSFRSHISGLILKWKSFLWTQSDFLSWRTTLSSGWNYFNCKYFLIEFHFICRVNDGLCHKAEHINSTYYKFSSNERARGDIGEGNPMKWHKEEIFRGTSLKRNLRWGTSSWSVTRESEIINHFPVITVYCMLLNMKCVLLKLSAGHWCRLETIFIVSMWSHSQQSHVSPAYM